MKPKVLVCVLTGAERTNWINPSLFLNLVRMLSDPRFELFFYPVHDARPWEFARNHAMDKARSMDADWLIMFDNDNFVYGNILDVVAEAFDKEIIGLTSAIGTAAFGTRPQTYTLCPSPLKHAEADGDFVRVEGVGAGALIIHRSVWKKIPRGPWFRWQHADNELLAFDPDKTIGEDFYFCQLAGENGIRTWTHARVLAGHYRTADFTTMATALYGLDLDQ